MNPQEKKKILHADIVVTHACNCHCPFCIDKFRNTNGKMISLDRVINFLDLIKFCTEKTDEFKYATPNKISILLLGGEPTMIGDWALEFIAEKIHERGFTASMSTNGILHDVLFKTIPLFDWTQITAFTPQFMKRYEYLAHKINYKIPADEHMDFHMFKKQVEYAKSVGFGRISMSMYFDEKWNEICTDPEMHEFLDSLEWERQGSYVYTIWEGVRLKRCIPHVTNVEDEPLIPKLYPNGNYNKTWCNEDNDPYLGNLP